jgi:hypothetical protein
LMALGSLLGGRIRLGMGLGLGLWVVCRGGFHFSPLFSSSFWEYGIG